MEHQPVKRDLQLMLTRRNLITGALAAPLVKSVNAQVVYPSVRGRRPMLWPGSGTKLRGAILYAPDWALAWAAWWWAWDWVGQIQPMLQAAAYAGANCIKFNLDGVSGSGFNYPPDSVTQAELNQICGYAASLGMVVYLQIGVTPQQQFGTTGANFTAGVAAAAKVSGWASAIPNIVGIDIMNEYAVGIGTGLIWPTITDAYSALSTMMAACRAACPNKPFTISHGGPDTTYLGAVANLCDYTDFHYYNYTNFGTFDSTITGPMRAAPWYQGGFIMGETGKPMGCAAGPGAGLCANFTALDQQNWMAAVPAVANQSDCLGACLWVLVDSFPPTPGNWGMFPQPIGSNINNPRPQFAPFSTWPGRL